MTLTWKVFLASMVIGSQSARPRGVGDSDADAVGDEDPKVAVEDAVGDDDPKVAVEVQPLPDVSFKQTSSDTCTTKEDSDWVVSWAGQENENKCYHGGQSPTYDKCFGYAKELWPDMDLTGPVNATNKKYPIGCSRVGSTLYFSGKKGKGADAIPICINDLLEDARKIAIKVNKRRDGIFEKEGTPHANPKVCVNLKLTKEAWKFAKTYGQDGECYIPSTATSPYVPVNGFCWNMESRTVNKFISGYLEPTYESTFLNNPATTNIGYARVPGVDKKWAHIAFIGCKTKQKTDGTCGCNDGCDASLTP